MGSVFAAISAVRMLIAVVKSKGGVLQVKKRDKRPSCLEDPSLGEPQIIYLEDVKLHYVVSGPEDKPLMLFVHGFPEFWYSWRHQIREFSSDYRVVAVDQRGYNESEAPDGMMNYSVRKLIKDLKQLIPALGYDKCVLVGHDWGGAIVWMFAMKYPHLVDRLIVLNGPHPGMFEEFIRTSWKQFKMSWYISFFQIPFIPEISGWINDYKMLEECFNGKKMGICNGKVSPEDVEAYKYAFSGKGGFYGPINYYRAALWDSRDPLPYCLIETPTLVIWGDKDVALDPQLAHVPKKYVSNLTVEHVENASHWVQVDQPDVVNKHIREFLKGSKQE
ncbi:epoxide hydrolase 1-like [Liolophura sinensis]|uniref:epoxide hydrolase 1-like n=1 Tax=Liolophura sinensis TaxID=3198878 RepID=UPI003159281F